MIEDFRLKVFIAVAQEKSFTRAASRLKVSQPAVSQNISELEKSFGVRFFERLRGEVVLTPAGEIFKKYAQEIMARYSELSMLFQRFPETIISVSSSEEVYDHIVGDVLKDFLSSHPEISFRWTMHDEHADLKIILSPVQERRGILAISYYPSSELASTMLWKVLSYTLQPTLKQ